MNHKRHVEIAGAGFAGLTAAISFAQAGWSVTVHEKDDVLRALGAGIFLWENGLRVLQEVDALAGVLRESVTPPYYITQVHETVASREHFGGRPWRTMQRAVLHKALEDSARRYGVEILTSSHVASATADGGLVLVDGSVRRADLVVGADGVASNTRDSLSFRTTGSSGRDGICRVLVERDPQHRGGIWDSVIDFWNFAPRVMRVLYVPVAADKLYLGLMASNDDPEASQIPIDLDLWIDMFPSLAPALTRVAALPNVRRDVYRTSVLDTWHAGRVALVGDAAHAMCPALAQGAGTGMMNALALGRIVGRSASMDEALATWERRTRPVTDACQVLSERYQSSRAMSRGNQFGAEVMQTANTDPVSYFEESDGNRPQLHDLVYR